MAHLRVPAHMRVVGDREPVTVADVIEPTCPEKPHTVAEDAELSRLWDEIVPVLDKASLISRADAPAIELALRHFVAAREASIELSNGAKAIWDDEHKRLMKNPADVVFRQQSASYLAYANNLGMTFAARSRAVLPAARGPYDVNPFAATG